MIKFSANFFTFFECFVVNNINLINRLVATIWTITSDRDHHLNKKQPLRALTRVQGYHNRLLNNLFTKNI